MRVCLFMVADQSLPHFHRHSLRSQNPLHQLHGRFVIRASRKVKQFQRHLLFLPLLREISLKAGQSSASLRPALRKFAWHRTIVRCNSLSSLRSAVIFARTELILCSSIFSTCPQSGPARVLQRNQIANLLKRKAKLLRIADECKIGNIGF